MILPDDTPHELKLALRRLVVATVALFVVVAMFGGFVWVSATIQGDEIRRVAVRTNTALCALRADLEQRIADSKQFLIDHPNGIPGISRADIERGIDGQQRTIDALAILDCATPEGATP